jgi:hypothetical protein
MAVDYFKVACEITNAHVTALKMADPTIPLADHEIIVETVRPGYAHIYRAGRCGRKVTVEDIQRRFYDPYFGGREARVQDGHWSAVAHTD